MQSRIRDAASRARNAAQITLSDRFGDPSPITFGATAEIGDTRDAAGHPLFANAGHVHETPELPDAAIEDFDNFVVLFSDMIYAVTFASGDIPDLRFYGASVNVGGRDGTGETAAFGSVDCVTGAAATNGAGGYITEVATAADTTDQAIYVPRVRRFQARVRVATDSTALASSRVVIGAVRTSTTRLLTTITDGLYFFLETDTASAGTWQVRSTAGSVTSSLETGIAPRISAGSVLFDTFKIDFDGQTASFFINDVPVGQLSKNIPGSSQLVAGWGAFLQTKVAAAKTMILDYLLYKGARVAS